MRAHAILLSLALGMASALNACVPLREPPAAAQAPLVWPESPAAPRITFVRAFSRPEDLGISQGFWARIGELLFGRTEVRLVRPMAVAVTPDGAVYVADPGAKAVYRFDFARGRYDLIRGPANAPLPSPVGLAVGAQGEVYVSDSSLRALFVIAPGSKTAAPVPLKATLAQPTGVAMDPTRGRLYVVDTGEHQIKVFDLDGKLLSAFGRRGTGDGEFNYPTLLWRGASGHLYVTDSLNFRTQIFDREGRFLGKFGQPGDGTGDLARPKGVATDSFGHIYIVDSLFHTVQVFDRSGEFLLHFGDQGRGPGEFWLPTGIFIGPQGMIYVADSHNQRVQVFRYVGGAS